MYCYAIVAETGNITKAAKRLYLTQSTLSKNMIALEERLDLPLLVRDGRTVTLTKEGEFLYEKWKSLIETFRLEIEEARAINSQKLESIRIGCFPVMDTHQFLLHYTDRIYQKYPQIWIEILRMNYIRLLEHLYANRVDLIFTLKMDLPQKFEEYEVKEVLCRPVTAVLSSEHPLAEKARISFEQLAEYPLLLSEPDGILTRKNQVERLLKTHAVLPENIRYVNNDLTAYLNAEQGCGVALGIRDLYPQENPRVKFVEVEHIDDFVVAVWKRSVSPALKQIIDEILE